MIKVSNSDNKQMIIVRIGLPLTISSQHLQSVVQKEIEPIALRIQEQRFHLKPDSSRNRRACGYNHRWYDNETVSLIRETTWNPQIIIVHVCRWSSINISMFYCATISRTARPERYSGGECHCMSKAII